MLNHISISNFAIIENTEIDFNDGLNIITGETGSGKSIVIEAINLALGARADKSMVRTGCDKAVIQLASDLDGKELVITREISRSGKNLCRLNGEIVTLAMLNERCSNLADIHGQYDNQSLLNPDCHIELIDKFGGSDIASAKKKYSESYKSYSNAERELKKLLAEEASNARKQDFYRFQLDEIRNASLLSGEDDELQERASLLQNSEKISSRAEKAYISISGEGGSLIELGKAVNNLRDISEYTSETSELASRAEDLFYSLDDLSSELRELCENITYSPEELDSTIARLDTIDRLKRKYGKSIDEILEFEKSLEEELSLIENFDEEKERLEKLCESTFSKTKSDGNKLSELRKQAATRFSQSVKKELSDLNFNEAKISAQFQHFDKPSANGFDHVEILISTNAGEELKPLSKTASGGEISRIMLAIKNITGADDHVPTMIFDEIDTGISGRTAAVVGKKLREISDNHQIICITHLPQIAAMSDYSYRIFKETDGKKTCTRVEQLSESEKIDEIARLLGGEKITETTRKNAIELINNG